MPPEERYGFKNDYTNFKGCNIRKTKKINPTFIFLSSIMIFKSISCFRCKRTDLEFYFMLWVCSSGHRMKSEQSLSIKKQLPKKQSITITTKTPPKATRGKTIPYQINVLDDCLVLFDPFMLFSTPLGPSNESNVFNYFLLFLWKVYLTNLLRSCSVFIIKKNSLHLSSYCGLNNKPKYPSYNLLQ